jgi:environmental stress-induced protein Ves
MQLLAPSDFAAFAWKNGRGTTYDIAAAWRLGRPSGDWGDILWRFGRTAIAEPGPFSSLAGFDRCQVVLRGEGLTLHGPNGFFRDLRRPFVPVRYRGEGPIESRLEAGPVEVLNLIAERASTQIDLAVPAEGTAHMLAPGLHIAYAPDEAAELDLSGRPKTLPEGHALRFECAAALAFKALRGRVAVASILPR